MCIQIFSLNSNQELGSELLHSPVTKRQVKKSNPTSLQLMNAISSVLSFYFPSPDFVFNSFPLLYLLTVSFHVQAPQWRNASADAS